MLALDVLEHVSVLPFLLSLDILQLSSANVILPVVTSGYGHRSKNRGVFSARLLVPIVDEIRK